MSLPTDPARTPSRKLPRSRKLISTAALAGGFVATAAVGAVAAAPVEANTTYHYCTGQVLLPNSNCWRGTRYTNSDVSGAYIAKLASNWASDTNYVCIDYLLNTTRHTNHCSILSEVSGPVGYYVTPFAWVDSGHGYDYETINARENETAVDKWANETQG